MESLLLLLLSVVLLFVLFSRSRRQQREIQQVQTQLAPGNEIMTASGMFATVVSLEDQVVVLETAPGQRSRWDRRAVARIIPPAAAHPSPEDTADDEGGPGPGQDPDITPPDRG